MLTIVASRRRGDISTWEGRTFSLGDYTFSCDSWDSQAHQKTMRNSTSGSCNPCLAVPHVDFLPTALQPRNVSRPPDDQNAPFLHPELRCNLPQTKQPHRPSFP